jgi:hypothetical protein
MATRYTELAEASLHELHLGQAGYHRAWVTSYERWRLTRGLGPLDPTEADWPVARLRNTEAGAA